MSAGVTVHELDDTGDLRGSSYAVSSGWLVGAFAVRNAHIATIAPNHVRGNHFHIARREILVVYYLDTWSLHWDTGEGTPVARRVFEGAGAVVLDVPPYSSHAIRNDGNRPLFMVGLADGPYDPAAPDAYPRTVVD